MRALSFRQAQRCEQAEGKRCQCRCGGAAHGKARGEVDDLPEDDPHFVDPERADKARAKARKAAGDA